MSQAILSRPGAVRPLLATLVILAAVSPLAINMFVPSMPSIADDLGAPYATVQLGLSLYLFPMAVLQLVAGPVSDRIGRRPVLIAGMTIFIIGSVVCTLAPNVEIFLAGRVIQTASAAGLVLSRTIIRDIYPREKSASMIGYVVMGMAVAPMIAPAIGGLADEIAGWRAPFVLLTLFGVAALVATLAFLPETNETRGGNARSQIATWGMLVRMPAFWLYAMTSTLASTVFFGFLGGGPAVSDAFLGQTPFEYGLWFSLCALGYLIGNFLSGRFSQQRGIEAMVRDGSLVTLVGMVVSLALFAFGANHPAALFIPIALIGVGNGLVLPNATAAVISLKPEASGAASGLLGAMQIGGGAIASVIGAYAAGGGHSPVGLTATLSIMALAALVVALIAIRAPGGAG
ncbi:MAG: multidrug effflux MFS transporter [Phyllobacteriaceae bacterium]|jgi:DHA1 family bicyclomycin/chloramphenicol resistance-like MFS transporter|nr:multidrug effflux MFS transporter [Phyllobacteriaceae bacterium]